MVFLASVTAPLRGRSCKLMRRRQLRVGVYRPQDWKRARPDLRADYPTALVHAGPLRNAGYGLMKRNFELVGAIMRGGPKTTAEIASARGWSRQMAFLVLTEMSAAGLVTRGNGRNWILCDTFPPADNDGAAAAATGAMPDLGTVTISGNDLLLVLPEVGVAVLGDLAKALGRDPGAVRDRLVGPLVAAGYVRLGSWGRLNSTRLALSPEGMARRRTLEAANHNRGTLNQLADWLRRRASGGPLSPHPLSDRAQRVVDRVRELGKATAIDIARADNAGFSNLHSLKSAINQLQIRGRLVEAGIDEKGRTVWKAADAP